MYKVADIADLSEDGSYGGDAGNSARSMLLALFGAPEFGKRGPGVT